MKKPTKDAVEAGINYLKAKTALACIEEQMTNIKTKILAENEYHSEPSHRFPSKLITDPKRDFTMSESDFKGYCDLVFVETSKLGIAVNNDPDMRCTRPYEVLLTEAEKSLLDEIRPIIDISYADTIGRLWSKRETVFDMIIKALVAFDPARFEAEKNEIDLKRAA